MNPLHVGPWMLRRREEARGRRLREEWPVVRRALRFAAPYRWQIGAFLAITVAGSFLAVVPPLLIRRLLDSVLPTRSYGGLNRLTGAAVGVAVGVALLSLAARWFSARVGEGLILDLRRALFDHVHGMPLAFFTRTQTGALISRLNNDVIGAQQAVTGTLGTVVSNVIAVASTVAVMLLIEWRLTLIALSILPLFVYPARRMGRRLQAATREQMTLNASLNTIMTERFNVGGALLVKLFGRRDRENAEFGDRAGRVAAIGVRIALFNRVFFVALSLVGAVGSAAVYWIGGRLVLSGAFTLGSIVAFSAYIAQLYGPLTQLTNARVELMSAFVSFDRVFEVLDLPHAIADRPGAAVLGAGHTGGRAAGRIDFDGVWFRYPRASTVSIASLEEGRDLAAEPEQQVVLRDVTFSVEPGHTVALVGPSGAGKTTIAMLVPRLYDVERGAVRVDGVDVRDLTIASLHAAVGIVPQDPHMFHDSIRNNLRYARPQATEEEIAGACRSAQILDLVVSLPEGFDTIVGERGYRLSGGEKQRIAIARVLLKDPAIVILDEATSHLDSESEALIQRALRVALEGRTSLVIAHRLSTVVHADEILVVEGGTVVERGRHTDLVGTGGLYRELYETQFMRAVP